MDQTPRPLAAFAFMLAGILSFTLMAVAGRELAGHHDTFEIMFYRSLLGIGIVLAVGGLAGSLGQINTGQIRLHGLRNVFHFTGQNLWFFAVGLIPLGQLFALEFTTPLWVALLAPLVLGERWRLTRGVAAVVGFAGILMVARPDTIVLSPGVVAAILSAFGFAGTMLVTKILSRRDGVTCILFWLVVFQSGFGLVTAGIDGDIAAPTAASLPWLAVVGCTGLFAHWCITNALKRAPASIVSPMEFLRLPAMAVTGYLLYAEPLEPAVFLGATMVLGANLLNIAVEQRRQNAPG
ncbi:EamA family transporter [Rhodobacteraceae bacterium 2CG4]|uniref:EamA family transporter n=1 Tax=Halovulum marinum TaxID=2662447 RepID=A0A6L5Z4R0_9RHOB|nr:DMT family transporter [Halovulum marinum]MSU90994.1 EamA family transporter [Halovulum marinum]